MTGNVHIMQHCSVLATIVVVGKH